VNPIDEALGIHPDPGDGGPDPLAKVDLGALVRAGRKEPRRFANGLMYPGKMHSLTGPPESCKTLIAIWAVLQVVSFGRNVVVIDEEAGREQTADMLAAFGADMDLVDKHVHYVDAPALSYGAADMARLGDLLRTAGPVFTVFDSFSAMLSYAGVDENKPGDVTRFCKRVLYPIAREFGSAVLVTAHDSKEGGNSRYGRGTTAILAEFEVAFKVSAIKPVTRAQDGIINFHVPKDRPAWLHRDWRIRITRDPLALHWDKAAETIGPDGLGPAAKKLLDVLDDTPMAIAALTDRLAAKYGHGLKRETASRCLTELMESGLADRIDQGPGRAALWLKRGNQLPEAEDPAGQALAASREARAEPPPPDGHGWPEGSAGAEANQ